MPRAGRGYRIHAPGLTHDERGYPATDAGTHDRLVRRLSDKLTLHAGELIEYEEALTAEAEVVLVAYGSTARSARRAVAILRGEGIKVGLLRLITAWPFPAGRGAGLSAR